MWRNVSWNSTESSLPEGMHKHETGAYFKTPSIQSATSSQSGGNSQTGGFGGNSAPRELTSEEPEQEVPAERVLEEPTRQPEAPRPEQLPQQQQQQQQPTKRLRLREGRGQVSGVNKSASGTTLHVLGAHSNPPAHSSSHVGFRSRLSSISGALQHPKITKRLFSGGQHSGPEEQLSPIQITTTSIDSPQHSQLAASSQPGGGGAGGSGHAAEFEPSLEAKLSSHSSGRRLSQLFLPQLPANPMLIQDPYGNNELIPAHLLGLYGQPPLVSAGNSAGQIMSGPMGGQRASWADISLFGRLSNVRPSIDSAFHSGQMRHSFDAHDQTIGSEQCNEQEHEERPSCVQIMKKLFFSLILGTIIAICWVMIIHTLKWIAIRGNEFEFINLSPSVHLQSSSVGAMQAPRGSYGTGSGFNEPTYESLKSSSFSVSLRAGSLATMEVEPEANFRKETTKRKERKIKRSNDDNDDSGEPQPSSTGEPQVVMLKDRHRQSVQREPPISSKKLMHLSSIVTQQSRLPHTQKPATNAQQSATSGGMSRVSSEAENEEPLKSELSPEYQPTSPKTEASDVSSNWPSPSSQARSTPPVLGLQFKAPFFTSWFISTWNIFFMPIFTLISSCCFRGEDSSTKKLLVRESISQFMDNGLTTLQFLGRCAFFSVLWIGTIFGIVYSLSNIDATVVMALFACSAALVYLLSWVLLHQQFVGVRIVAVIICTTGIALLAYMDNSRTLGSVLIVAGSALCSAVYKVIYQRMFGFWSIAQMSLFFTLIGLFNAFLMWPVALLLYFLGVELIVWRYIPWMHLIAAGALHLTANIVAYFGPICSYDIFLTMGLLLAVIFSAVIDVAFYKITFFGMKLAGVLLLMIGFLVCLLPENWNEFLYDLVNERFVRWKKQRSLKKSRNKVQDMSTGQMSRLRTPSGRVK